MALECFDLENQDHVDFLERLAHDDDLRADMESDAMGTLKANGFDPEEGDLPEEPHQLPSKEEISSKLQEAPEGMNQFNPDPFLKGGWESES